MNNNPEVLQKIYNSMLTYMRLQSRDIKANCLGGFPCECYVGPKKEAFEKMHPSIAENLMTLFIVYIAEHNGPVDVSIDAAEKYINQREDFYEPTRNFENVLFKAAFCLPAKYIPLLIQKGFDVNEQRSHPAYTDWETKEKYSVLAFAAYEGDAQKVRALLDAGADKSKGFDAANLCVGSKITTTEQKIACLGELKMAGVRFLDKDQYEHLRCRCQDRIVRYWLEEAKEGYEAQRIVAHQSKTKNPETQNHR